MITSSTDIFPSVVLLCSLEGEGQHDRHGTLRALPSPTPRQIQCPVARKRAAPNLPHSPGVGSSVTGRHVRGKTIRKGFPQSSVQALYMCPIPLPLPSRVPFWIWKESSCGKTNRQAQSGHRESTKLSHQPQASKSNQAPINSSRIPQSNI